MLSIDIEGLKYHLIRKKLFNSSYKTTIDWAISQLLNDVDDINVALIAGSNYKDEREIEAYIENILGKNNEFSDYEVEEIAGKIIVEKSKEYLNGCISILEIENIIYKFYLSIDSDWLIVLSRNAEYATDIDYFVKPFEKELKYISRLWETYPTYNEFYIHYNRDISNMNLE